MFTTIMMLSYYAITMVVAKDIHDPLKQSDPLKYYHLHFQSKKKKHPLRDTLFEKTVWDRKVSHIVIEQKNDYSWVTLLMIKPKGDIYKSKNYAIHYQFKDAQEAVKKYFWLNKFLSQRGVLRVQLFGKMIVQEKILFNGYPKLKY